jgi:type II secretory pathway pseudopilin PulG
MGEGNSLYEVPMFDVVSNNRGMTLVETVVAAVISALIVGALLGSLLAADHSVRMTRTNMEALNVLSSSLEQQKAQTYVALTSGTTNNVILSDGGTAAPEDDVLGTIAIVVTDNGDSTKSVVATATWTERFLNQTITRSVALSTLVSEP